MRKWKGQPFSKDQVGIQNKPVTFSNLERDKWIEKDNMNLL